jgi:hypothetical protein
VYFDLENDAVSWRGNVKRIAKRREIRVPRVPKELDVQLLNDSTEGNSSRLLSLLGSSNQKKVDFLYPRLLVKPNALVVIDPLELFFSLDKIKGPEVLRVYRLLREVRVDFPQSAFLVTFNLRKRDRRAPKPNLLDAPRDWLDEVAGSIDIMNRSDVRLGIDVFDENIRVINGIRRGEEFHPLIIEAVGPPEGLAGFERVEPDALVLRAAFTKRQRRHWYSLPEEFRFDEVADNAVPRASLFRLIGLARSLGVLRLDDGVYRKVSGESTDR